MIPCMGGFCSKREKCANYYADGVPVERLCGPEDDPEPLTQDNRKTIETVPQAIAQAAEQARDRKPKKGGFKD